MNEEEGCLSEEEKQYLLEVLKKRFEKNTERHLHIEWTKVEKKLLKNPKKLWSLAEMERTGGEPDIINYNKRLNEYIFCDCSKETPSGRRSLCYDLEALNSRKQHKPKNNAIDMAKYIGIDILTENQYQELQELGEFDTKTSSWIMTPREIRKLGGALFCDRRYNHVFLYYNGAQSYYSTRGFRGLLKV